MSEKRAGDYPGVEKRRHRRVPLQVPIECRGGDRVMLVKSENISISGLLVRCMEPFDQDSEITVSFTLAGSRNVVTSPARVAHVVPGVFMGLEFSNLSAEAQTQIEQFVAAAASTVPKK